MGLCYIYLGIRKKTFLCRRGLRRASVAKAHLQGVNKHHFRAVLFLYKSGKAQCSSNMAASSSARPWPCCSLSLQCNSGTPHGEVRFSTKLYFLSSSFLSSFPYRHFYFLLLWWFFLPLTRNIHRTCIPFNELLSCLVVLQPGTVLPFPPPSRSPMELPAVHMWSPFYSKPSPTAVANALVMPHLPGFLVSPLPRLFPIG